MSPPRSTAVQAVVACCLLAVVAVGPGVTAVTADDSSGSVGEQRLAAPCDPTASDAYRPPDLDDPWRETATDGDRRLNWSGGESAPVGPTDDCSLAVANGATASPNDTLVRGDGGVVTGIVDLGANGSIAFLGVATATASNGTTTTAAATDNATAGATELVLANPGAATARNVSVRANGSETTLTVPNGRFFEFAVRWTGNGTARVAVWDSDDPWDGEWDVTVTLAEGADWSVELRGPVYLDGLAIGVSESPAEPTTARPDDGESEDQDDSEDDFFPDDYETASDPRADSGGGAGGAVLGFLLLLFGAGSAYFARPVARISEQIDAIGSTTPASEVEPAGWNVMLTRIVGIILAVVGAAMIVGGL